MLVLDIINAILKSCAERYNTIAHSGDGLCEQCKKISSLNIKGWGVENDEVTPQSTIWFQDGSVSDYKSG